MTTTQNLTDYPEIPALHRVFRGRECSRNAGRAIAKALGYEGRSGGWIYYAGTNRTVCQGYDVLATRYGVRYDRDLGGCVIPAGSARNIERDADIRARLAAAKASA